jgi:hypothetical protein
MSMSRSTLALTLTLGSLLFGCGGQPEDGEALAGESATDRPVSAFAPTATTIGATAVLTDSDNLLVSDTSADGHSAVGQLVVISTGAPYDCWNSAGAGTSYVPPGCNFNFRSGLAVRYRACLGEAGTGSIFGCGGWITTNAALAVTK